MTIAEARAMSQKVKVDYFVVHKCECKWLHHDKTPSCGMCNMVDTTVSNLNAFADSCEIMPHFRRMPYPCPKTGCDDGGTRGGWCANFLPDGTHHCKHKWCHRVTPHHGDIAPCVHTIHYCTVFLKRLGNSK